MAVIHNWMRMILAILLGNLIYFAAQPILPTAMRHHLYTPDAGLILDFSLCLGIYLLLRKSPDKE